MLLDSVDVALEHDGVEVLDNSVDHRAVDGPVGAAPSDPHEGNGPYKTEQPAFGIQE